MIRPSKYPRMQKSNLGLYNKGVIMSFEKYCEFREGEITENIFSRGRATPQQMALRNAYKNAEQTIKGSSREAVDLPVEGGEDFFQVMMKADDMLRRGAKGVNFTFQNQRYFVDNNRMNHAMQQLQRIFQLI